MSAIQLQEINKTFPGGHQAVVDFNLDVGERELVILVGPSGCGKSTVLRILAGIEPPTSGRVILGGEDVTDVTPQKRDIAMVFQNYALYPHKTVRDNLAFGLKMRRVDRGEIEKRVAAVAAMLDIDTILDRKPSQLSGGQRQRVALGRAMARQAKAFLLDEPLSNLDAQLRLRTRTELAELHQKLDAPMIYVTHDQEEAMTLGDRIVIMRDGRILQIGPPMEVYSNPRTAFVGCFIGSPPMNLLQGRCVVDGDRIRFDGDGFEMRFGKSELRVQGDESASLAGFLDEQGGAPRDVLLGIRPESIELTELDSADIEATIEVIEPLGKEVLIHVTPGRMDNDPQRGGKKSRMRVLTRWTSLDGPGTKIGLRFRRDEIHLFDSRSEESLL